MYGAPALAWHDNSADEAKALKQFHLLVRSRRPGGPHDGAQAAARGGADRHAAPARASRRAAPAVLVLEDMHWCDTGTEDWIARLAEGIAAKRVLLVVTCRPGYRPPIGASSYFTTLALATLSAEESLQIAAGLLGVEELPPELRALVVDTAEGNPFFVEEPCDPSRSCTPCAGRASGSP